MKHFFDASSDTHLLVLRKGEELMRTLDEFAVTQSLAGGWVDIVGGAANATLGYYDPAAKQYRWQRFEEPLEITGLHGNLSYADGRPLWHVHGTFSRADYSVLGGHVKECLIGLTGEVLLTTRRDRLTRVHDEETGLKLLAAP
ncbi:DNA-binding protein [Microbacterium capsulatum]|uniref:DNA-binding protein n=1 Tax=Microbacterium capsulatum TaxID=3041921 RepID=A0ABU0XDB7_9MICO|nr:DNA-binding protein [Microbacterium sp. ASV81]MDQ4212947.1 DNA-binding protein [Microbacterium sp. ASV81]